MTALKYMAWIIVTAFVGAVALWAFVLSVLFGSVACSLGMFCLWLYPGKVRVGKRPVLRG